MYNKKTVRDIDLNGKTVIMRADFNVPLDDTQTITDDTRIKAALPTIQYILDNQASLILMSHLGRPKGEVKSEFSLKPVSKKLSELLGKNVEFASDCIGEEVKSKVKSLQAGQVLLLENLRFHKEETDNDENFAKELASLADVYVNDAFGTAHRAHASTEGITKFMDVAVAGFLIGKEVDFLGKALENPKKPFVLVLGGAKVSSKIGVIEHLLSKVDSILIGGGMAYTFLKSKGLPIGKSMLESEKQTVAFEILKKANEKGVTIYLPIDHIAVEKFDNKSKKYKLPQDKFPENLMGVDIGPKTISLYKKVLKKAQTIVWNGPMGVFEMPNFAKGTKAVAKVLASSKAVTIVGGGDSVSALKQTGLTSKISHVSTGGGASLEFLEGKTLPGIAALNDK